MAKRKTLQDYAKERLAELGMDELAITTLLSKTPAQRTKELIVMFASRQTETERTDVLDLLACIGEVKRTGDFFSDILEGDDDWLKLTVALPAWLFKKYRKHRRLQQALATHLKGSAPVEVWARSRFPNCDLDANERPLQMLSTNAENSKEDGKNEEE